MKMKVGGPIDNDVRRAHIIREEIGPDALLMMGANQAWDVDEAIARCNAWCRSSRTGSKSPHTRTTCSAMLVSPVR